MTNTDYKSRKLIQIVKEWEGNNQNRFEINGADEGRAVFFYREVNKKFVPLPRGSYEVERGDNGTFLRVTNRDIQTKAIEYQMCYEDEQISSRYEETYPELQVLVQKYNDVVLDIRNLISYLKSVGMKSDTLQMTQIMTKLQRNTFWYLNDQGELDAFPIGQLNEKYAEMLESVKSEALDHLTNQHSRLKADLQNVSSGFTTRLEREKQDLIDFRNNAQSVFNSRIDTIKQNATDAITQIKTTASQEISETKRGATQELAELKRDSAREMETHKQTLIQAVTREINALENTVASFIRNNEARFKGEKGDQGLQGIQGLRGERGPQGQRGEKGDRGEGITSVESIGNNRVRITYGDRQTMDMALPTVSESDVSRIGDARYLKKNVISQTLTSDTTSVPSSKVVTDAIRTATENAPKLEVRKIWEGNVRWDYSYEGREIKICNLPSEWTFLILSIGDISIPTTEVGGGFQKIFYNARAERYYLGLNDYSPSFKIENNVLFLIRYITNENSVTKVEVLV